MFAQRSILNNSTKKHTTKMTAHEYFWVVCSYILEYAPKQPQTAQSILHKKYVIYLFSGFGPYTHKNIDNFELIDIFCSMCDCL